MELLAFFIPVAVYKAAAAISIPVAIAAVVKLIFSVDTKVENRRRIAIEISERLNENGLTMFSELLQSYAVGDKSGMITTLVELKKIVRDPVALEAQLKRLFSIQLNKMVKDPTAREEIVKTVHDMETLEAADIDEKARRKLAAVTSIGTPIALTPVSPPA